MPTQTYVSTGQWHLAHLSHTLEIAALIEHVLDMMASLGYSREDRFGTRLALEEALVNAIKHGHNYDPTKIVKARYSVRRERVLFQIEDEGPGFDPYTVPDPTDVENLERNSGRGLLLMRTYLSWIRFNRRANAVTLCKYPSAKSRY